MKIQIPQPCHEDWGKMTPNEQGRHCASCDKTVVDFTQMNDKQIAAVLQNSSSTCGRFSTYQLNRELVLHPTPQKHFGLLKVAACAVLSVNLLDGFSQNVPQNSVETHQAENHPNDNDTEIPFNGVIKFKVSGTSDQLESLARIHFKINDFQIVFDEIELDRVYEFHVPDSVIWKQMEIEVISLDTEPTLLTLSKNEWIKNYQSPENQIEIYLSEDFVSMVINVVREPDLYPEYLKSYAMVTHTIWYGNVTLGLFTPLCPEDVSGILKPQSELHPPILITNPEPENIKEEDDTKLVFKKHKAEMFQEKVSIWKTLYYLILASFVGFATNWTYKRRNKLKEDSKSKED